MKVGYEHVAHLDADSLPYVGAEVDGIRLQYGGSMSKRTYVDGLSDFDMLAIVNNTEIGDKSPEELKRYFAQMLRQRLPYTEISVGKLAVTVKFSTMGHEFQILPALRTSTGITIAKADGSGWSNVVRPRCICKKLTKINQDKGNKVVPVIKLFKALNSQMPKDSQMSGYHIESLAVDAFSSYSGRPTYKDMLQHLCEYASEAVKTPKSDETGQSVYVDSDLGPSGSVSRHKISAALNRLSSRMRSDNSAADAEDWTRMF